MKPGLWLVLLFVVALPACVPTAPPSPAFVTVTPALTPPPRSPEDFSVYRKTMLPDFQTDVDRLAAAGITRYQIEAALHFEEVSPKRGPRLEGRLRVNFTNTEAVILNQLHFRMFPNTPGYGGLMTATHVLVNGQAAPFQRIAGDTTLQVTLPRPLPPGQAIDVSLAYRAVIPPTTQYGYGLYGYQDNVLALAGFFPIIPAFDDRGWHVEDPPLYGDAPYTDIALFDVTLTAPREMVIVTSGDILTTTFPAENLQTIHAFSGPVRDFFVAMSPDYQSTGRMVDGVTVTGYFLSGRRAQGETILRVAADALSTFGQLFGPYPYRAFDVVAVPMPPALGGVEFPGVVAMAGRYYLQPDDLVEFVTAHEVAHQWWYGLVGNDPVNYPWLDEALTQYSAVNYFEQIYGPQKRAELVDTWFRYPYNQLSASGADRRVGGSVDEFSETEYSLLVYGKGPLFFEAMRGQLGDPRYFAALRAYAEAHRYGLATPTDLLNAFEQAGGDPTGLYREWIGPE